MVEDDLRIRRYDPRDEDAVWDLHVRALAGAGAYDEEFAHLDEDLRRIESAYLTAGEFLVGEYANEIVAMGGFQPDDGAEGPWTATQEHDPNASEPTDAAVLRRMRVDPDHQRRGFGTAILRELESRARDRGFRRVVLDTTARQEAAVAFYESHGYGLWRRETVELEGDGPDGEQGDTLEMRFYEKSLEE